MKRELASTMLINRSPRTMALAIPVMVIGKKGPNPGIIGGMRKKRKEP
jgi:hypothetical protein